MQTSTLEPSKYTPFQLVNYLETRFNASHRAPRPAVFTLQEENSGVLLQDGVGGTAGVAGDILLDVASQHNFNLLLLEATLDDQLAVAVHRATRTQLSK
jgi:hypothetical protein